MSTIDHYIVAGNRPWNRRVFDQQLAGLPGRWSFASAPEELETAIEADPPRYVFFLHWSWIVPRLITETYECVNFHMTDVPYGRGGSPLQNLIVRGRTETVLTALRMTTQLDAGPVYCKRPLRLDGTAQQIYERSSLVAAEMITEILRERPDPTPQEEEPLIFERRRPEQSAIGSDLGSLSALYDHIRMLDADTYPHAFLERAGFRFEFRDARLEGDEALTAVVRVTRATEDTA